MYKLGGMEDVLRTTLAGYAPQRTGDERIDRERTEAFAQEVRAIIYRMRGIEPNHSEPQVPEVVCGGLVQRLDGAGCREAGGWR